MKAIVIKLEAVIDLLGKVAAYGTVLLVLLVATNVLLRYFFSTGSVWSQELEWHLLVPIVLLGIPYALSKGDYVRVDVLYERMPERTQVYLDIFAAIIGLSVALLMVKYSIPYVEKSWGNNEGSPDPGGLPARYALKSLLIFGFAVLSLQQFLEILKGILKLKGDPIEEHKTASGI